MEVNVILFAALRKYGPPNLKIGESFKVQLDERSTLIRLLEKIRVPKKITLIIMVNGEIQDNYNHSLKNEDHISIFPYIGGGIMSYHLNQNREVITKPD
ncbi:MAG: MoaD/ThiS family protein [Candidatus Hodarchaeota archaeon]